MTVSVVHLIDQVPGNNNFPGDRLPLACTTITAGEIISARLRASLSACHKTGDGEVTARAVAGNGVFLPVDSGAAGGHPLAAGSIEMLLEAARSAFDDRQFVLIFNGVQLDHWNERVDVLKENEARFIRLVPLAGG